VNLRRRDLLRSAPFAVPALKARLAQASVPEDSIAGMNVILFLTDQERHPALSSWLGGAEPARHDPSAPARTLLQSGLLL
jgi:hypothetical protein